MNLPKGCIEYNPKFQNTIDNVISKITNTYSKYGFQHLDTSIIQYIDELSGAGEISKEIYSLARAKDDQISSKTDYALRFDLTKPLARHIEENRFDITFPFKRWDYGQVFRGERPQKGRYRQFYQCDFDIVGKENLSLYYDYEVCSVVCKIMSQLKIQNFTLKINNRKLLNDIFALLQINPETSILIMNLLDKFYKLEKNVFQSELEKITSTTVTNKLLTLLNDGKGTKLSDVKPLFDKANIDIQNSVGYLELTSILEFATEEELSKIEFNLAIVRGLDYYTGFVFETYLDYDTKLGSIFSGGRYEKLIEADNIKYPGVGGSVGISRLASYLEAKSDKEISSRNGYLVNIITKNNTLLDKVNSLRENGELVSVVELPFKKALKVAIKENFDKFVYLNDQNIIIEKQVT